MSDIDPNLTDYWNTAKDAVSDGYKAIANSSVGKDISGYFDAAKTRLNGAVLPGGLPASLANSPSNAPAAFTGSQVDWRVKISLGPNASYFYKAATKEEQGILSPLVASGGVVFPYTPTISVTHSARYSAQSLTHSNYTNYAYEASEVAAFTIAGDFSAQSTSDAAYVLAVVQFFRSATKMWFGGGNNVGSPPPMVFLTGFGEAYFPNVPCVITSFQHTLPNDVDYISAGANKKVVSKSPNAYEKARVDNVFVGSNTWVPTNSNISVTLQPIYSRKSTNSFDLNKFAAGGKLTGGFI